MKRFLSFFALAAVVCGFAACGGNDGNVPEQAVVPNYDDPNAVIINPISTYGMMPGKFKVDDKGTYVQFSQGNLQYYNDMDETKTKWRFANRQWEVLGYANINTTGWHEFFYWGTGDQPMKTNVNIAPGAYAEWGYNRIENGTNQPNYWRTLSKEEWYYIFHKRPNASKRCGLGNINGVNGLILLPDNWVPVFNEELPGFVTCLDKFTIADAQKPYKYSDATTPDKNHFLDNTYSETQWLMMEAMGAIFLPAAGFRFAGGNTVTSLNSLGGYWSSSGDEIYGYQTRFEKNRISTGQENAQKDIIAGSVRVVRNAN